MSSLVHVLKSLAAKWVLCECGLRVGTVGNDGWEKKGLRLASAIDSLNAQISRIRKPAKIAEMQAELAKLEAESAALTDEWSSAIEETDELSRLFDDACDFCVMNGCGGSKEIFNAALVGFDSSQLKDEQEPSKQRMSDIVKLLKNLSCDEWETQPWANPIKLKMRSRRQVSLQAKQSFKDDRLGNPSVEYAGNETVEKPKTESRAGAVPSGKGDGHLKGSIPRVTLKGQPEQPEVDGKSVEPLTVARYDVVGALLKAGPAGHTKRDLVTKSGHGSAVNVLKGLAKVSKAWKAVVKLPGSTGQRYALRFK